MKAIIIEPFLVVIVSLFWIIVLPFAVLCWSGIAISDRVEALHGASSWCRLA
jgi:hypothetical protein